MVMVITMLGRPERINVISASAPANGAAYRQSRWIALFLKQQTGLKLRNKICC